MDVGTKIVSTRNDAQSASDLFYSHSYSAFNELFKTRAILSVLMHRVVEVGLT